MGTASQRHDEAGAGGDAVALMVDACRAAATDAGSSDLLSAAGLVAVPRGTWSQRDAGRLVAKALGASSAHTVVAELGVLQSSLIRRAAGAIAAGQVDVAVVVGGEARWRDLVAARAGVALPGAEEDGGGEAAEVMRPEGAIVAPAELAAGLYDAPSHYSLLEVARRWADGQSTEEHRQAVASLWARFNAVARTNPEAWFPAPLDDAALAGAGAGRVVAWPYRKWHCSQWNVDQAGAVVLASLDAARSRGVAAERMVFPHVVVESNALVPVSQRRELHRSPAFSVAGREAGRAAGVGLGDIEHVDLYSCFPIAVRTQMLELGLSDDPAPTLTGGMAFAGGPLNNYVLQSIPAVVRALRADPGSRGLVTAISGMITKAGVTIWVGEPPAGGFRACDVSAEVAAASPAVPIDTGAAGAARIVSYTVAFDGDRPGRAVIVAETAGGARAVAASSDVVLAEDMGAGEWCGRSVRLDGAGGFAPVSPGGFAPVSPGGFAAV